jgi:hypothetical protein
MFKASIAAQMKMEHGKVCAAADLSGGVCAHVTRVQAAAASTLHNMALLFKNTGRLQESAQASATPN